MGYRAAALFLLYALYFKQPLRPIVKIRVNLSEYKDLVNWTKELREDEHWEVVFCWARLISDHAFLFVGSTQHLGLEFSSKLHKVKGDTFEKEPSYREHFFSSMFESLRKTHGRYNNMKKALMSSEKSMDNEWSDNSDNFPEKIAELVNKVHKKQNPDVKSDIGLRRKRIMEKARLAGLRAIDIDESETKKCEEEFEEKFVTKMKRKKKRGKPNKKVAAEKEVKSGPNRPNDLKTLARSLTAVQEDPSLLEALNEYKDVFQAKKKGRGRPKINDKISKTKKIKKNSKNVKDEEILELNPGEFDDNIEIPKKKNKGKGKQSKVQIVDKDDVDETLTF